MKDRLMKIITSEGLTPSLLADEMGLQRSGISHILSGRNYPSFDFMQKLLTRFPKLNAEWLILGHGSMYKSVVTEIPDLFSAPVPEQKTPLSPTPPKNAETLPPAKPEILSSGESAQTDSPKSHPQISLPAETKKAIEKIIILYTDKSFASYFPE